jgi:hypothetical protein
MRKVYGVAINDIRGSSRSCQIYKIWMSMLSRCYSKKVHSRQPNYKGCNVCLEWLVFSNFKKWVESQDWKGKQLDKDVISPGNATYCPEKSRFVSPLVNSLITFKKSKNSKHMLGVYRNDSNAGTFKAQVSKFGKIHVIGTFKSEIEAHKAYIAEKVSIIKAVADSEDSDIRDGLYLHAEKLQKDLRETINKYKE